MRTHTSNTLFAGMLMLMLATPMPALAYLSPEEVLLNLQFQESLLVPPPSRHIKDRVLEQARLSAERREREQALFFALQRPPQQEQGIAGGSDATLQSAIAALAEAIFSLRSGAETSDVRRTARLLDRIAVHQELFGERTLRSGAPIAETGPGSIVALAAILVATGWTLWHARMPRVRR